MMLEWPTNKNLQMVYAASKCTTPVTLNDLRLFGYYLYLDIFF